MLLLNTIRHDTIWGGPKIERYTGVVGSTIGHLYSLYCRDGISNEILNGQWAGRCLNEVFPLFRDDIRLSKYKYFPLTLALTEADQNLSIQVHPDDNMADSIHSGTRGKRESWYFIETPDSGSIINGCTCRNEDEVLAMIAGKRFMEMADTLPVNAGDYVFVEPGTLHAITAGSLVYEIEEGSDQTYRFYDYDRRDEHGNPRELHIEQASIALHPKLKSRTCQYPEDGEIAEATYATRLIKKQYQYTNESATMECFTFISGRMQADGFNVKPGSTVMLWPSETVQTNNVELAFVARPNINH